MNAQIAQFIIRRGCRCSWLRAALGMEVRCFFLGMAAVTGSREGENASPWSQLPPLRRVLFQQPQSGGDGD